MFTLFGHLLPSFVVFRSLWTFLQSCLLLRFFVLFFGLSLSFVMLGGLWSSSSSFVICRCIWLSFAVFWSHWPSFMVCCHVSQFLVVLYSLSVRLLRSFCSLSWSLVVFSGFRILLWLFVVYHGLSSSFIIFYRLSWSFVVFHSLWSSFMVFCLSLVRLLY